MIASVSLLGFAVVAHAALAPRNPADGVAIIYAPWIGPETAFRLAVDAGARFVRYGSLSFIVVVMPDSPDFSARARAGGALMLADPAALAACFTAFRAGGKS